MITNEQGAEWIAALNRGEEVWLHMTYASRAQDFVNSAVNTVSKGYIGTTSSWGMGWELEPKPSFTAPGGNILSTYPLRLSLGYAVLSGTSMASPFVAGVYALLMEATGIKDPAALESRLASTADPNLWFDGQTLHSEALAPVPQQGAGLIRAYDAAMTKTVVSPASIALNDSAHFLDTVTVTIENKNDKAVTYALSHIPALTIYTATDQKLLLAQFPNPTSAASATLAFSATNLTIPAGGKADVTVKTTPPSDHEVDAARLPIYSGYIVINSTTPDSLSIPYTGLLGTMKSIPIIDTRPDKSYLQFWDMNQRLKPAPGNQSFTVEKPRPGIPPSLNRRIPLPSALFKLQAGTAHLTVLIQAVGAAAANVTSSAFKGTGNIVGTLPNFPQVYVPRNVFEEAFAGVTAEGTIVPEGTYNFVIKALRISGDRASDGDWQTAVVGPFKLKYGTPTLAVTEPATHDPFGFP
jgi:hypothetical protein